MRCCPVCGSPKTFPHPAGEGKLIVCSRCSETLYPYELVKRATRKTRRAYAKANPESEV